MKDSEAIRILGDTTLCTPLGQAAFVGIEAIKKLQKYQKIETEIREQYRANVDIEKLMQYFIETIFKGEKHERFCVLTNEDAMTWEEYQSLGTVDEIRNKMKELARWHSDRLNSRIKNEFAAMSTLICHNCDHKDEYIEELESDIEEYHAIGTIEECRAAVEKQREKKPIMKTDDGIESISGLSPYCPLCGCELTDRIPFDNKDFYFHCLNCGQKFDWSDSP